MTTSAAQPRSLRGCRQHLICGDEDLDATAPTGPRRARRVDGLSSRASRALIGARPRSGLIGCPRPVPTAILLDGRSSESYYRGVKLSVSVPDDLWEQASRQVDADSPSAIVQAALNRFVGDGRGGADYAVRPELADDLAAALEAARAHIVGQARELYQAGYRKGVKFAGELNFHQLAYIVGVGSKKAAEDQADVAFDIDTRRLLDGHRPFIEPRELIDYLGSYADYTNSGFPTPAAPTIEGIDRALADVWDAVHSANADAAETSTEHAT